MKAVWFLGFVVLVLVGCSEKSVQVVNPGEDLTQAQLDSIRLDSLRMDSISRLDSLMENAAYLLGSSSVVFDQDSLYTFEIEMDSADLKEMNDQARAELYYPGTLKVKGFELGKVGVRYKGNYGSLTSCTSESGKFVRGEKCDKLSMKIKFNEYQNDLRFYGLKKVNMHAMMHDGSLFRDRLGYKLYREMGVVAPRATHAQITLNGENWGVFIMVEQIDGRFTAEHFPNDKDGNVYKEVWPQHSEGQAVHYTSALKTNEEEQDVSGIVKFAEWLKQPKSSREGSISDWMSVDNSLRYLAVEDVINNWDGFSAWYCFGSSCKPHNFYLFESESHDRFTFVPWDLDASLHAKDPYSLVPNWNEPYDEVDCKYSLGVKVPSGNELLAPICDPLVEIFANDYKVEYKEIVAEFLEGPFSEAEGWIDTWVSQISASVQADGLNSKKGNWSNSVNELKSDIRTLREIALARLEGKRLEELKIYTEKTTDFEELTQSMVTAGNQTYVSENTDYRLFLSDEGLSGGQSLGLDFVFRDNEKSWGAWGTTILSLDVAQKNLSTLKSIKLIVNSTAKRDLRFALTSLGYDKVAASQSMTFGWDIKLVEGEQVLDLDVKDLSWTSWGIQEEKNNDINEVLEKVTGLSLSASAVGVKSGGFLGEGVEDKGQILMDDIIFVYE